MKRLWLWFLARFHLSDKAVCEMSDGLSMFADYHDYQDTIAGQPFHFVELECKRCGKKFYL